MRSISLLLAAGLLCGTAFAQTPFMAPAASTGGGLNKVFDEADTNHDGYVTKQEFEALADKHFAIADTNHDGKVSREEMQAQQAAIMQNMQQHMLGGNWQQKLNQFMGTPAASSGPVAPTVAAPVAPVMQTTH